MNKTIKDALKTNNKLHENAFLSKHGRTLVCNVESYSKQLSPSEKDSIYEYVRENENKLLTLFPGTTVLEINVL